MDLASTLIRSVVRAFYETRHILVIDALFIHSVLNADDLAFLLGVQPKDLRKLCARLREDRLIAVHARPELKDGATRPVNRDYYYIPLHPVIDAIKYRVSKLTSIIRAQYTPSEDRKEYICLRCESEWTELDVLSLYSEEGFECQNCGALLERTEDVKGTEGIDRTGHEKNSKLMNQLDNILKVLKQIDSVEVPPNDFDAAWDHKVDVPRNLTHPTRPAVAVVSKKQEIVRGTTKTDATALEISLASSEEKSLAEQAEEASRKAALEKQNALPIWHTHSTVSTMAGNVGYGTSIKTETADVSIKPDIKGEDEEQKPTINALDDKVAAYYAEIEREKALQAQAEVSSAEEDSDEEDEEDFEDVSGASGSGSATPAAFGAGPTGAQAVPSVATDAAGVKRQLDTDSGSSAPQTTVGTPATSFDEGPVFKRIKAEPEIKKEEGEGESDEDDEEFEDV